MLGIVDSCRKRDELDAIGKLGNGLLEKQGTLMSVQVSALLLGMNMGSIKLRVGGVDDVDGKATGRLSGSRCRCSGHGLLLFLGS